MDSQRMLRRVAVATCLLFSLGLAAVGAVVGLEPDRVMAATGVTALSLDREPNNVVSYNDDPDGSFVLLEPDILTVETGRRDDIRGLRFESTYASGRGSWSFAFAPPKGETLHVGEYTNAAHVDYRTEGQPGISVQGQMYCEEATGRFAIREIETTPTGFAVLSATFRFKCSEKGRSFNPGWVYGEIRYNASEGFRAASATPTSIDFGTLAVGADAGTVNVTVTSIGTLPVSLGEATIVGQDETAFSVESNGCDGLTLDPGEGCGVQVSASPHAARALVARLVVRDDTDRGKRAVPLEVSGGTDPVWAYDWGSVGTAARKYTWTDTGALGVTDTTTPRLQAVFVSPFVGGKWITDKYPRLGVYHTRKGIEGTRWSGGTRLNGTNYHGTWAALAASGQGVYVTWVGMEKYLAYDPKAPRILFFRRNFAEGGASEWRSIVRLTSKTGRVGPPAIAASDPHVYIVWVASSSGNLILAASHDRGRTFSQTQIGMARSKDASGYWGAPSIAADGLDVIVAWWPKQDTTVNVRISNDAGATFTAADVVGYATRQAAVATRDGRFGVALANGEELDVRLNEDGTWSPLQGVPRLGTTKPQAPSLVLRGTNGVGLTYPACSMNCNFETTKRTESRLVWRYSDDDGEHWSRARTLADSGTSRYANDSPSLVWPPGGRRAVLFLGWTRGTSNFRVYSIEGDSIDPASAGPLHELAVDAPMPVFPDIERTPAKGP